MKKSDIYFLEPNTNGAPLDRYFAYDFAQATSDFLSVNYEDSVDVSSKIEDALFINICSVPAAAFLHRAFKFHQNKGVVKIHIQDLEDMLYILIRNERKVKMEEEEKLRIIDLARSAGFYIHVDETTGAIIAKCETEKAAAIVEAITVPTAFAEYLEAAFAE